MANSWIRPGGAYTENGAGGAVAPSIGYVSESVSEAAVGSITLTEITQYRVFEGAAGSAQVTLSGSHTGPTDTIEYRIEQYGGAAVTAWATLQASVAEGAFSAAVTVPRGGWYVARVRKAANTAIEAVQTQRWGVGVILGGMGQSQLVIWNGTGTYLSTPDPRAVIHDGTIWSQMTTSGRYRNQFAAAVIAALDCPVAVIAYGSNGSSVSQWYRQDTGKQTNYNTWESRVTAAGGKLTAALWWQGEGDISRTKAAYLSDVTALLAQLRTDYGAALPIIMPNLGPSTDGPTLDANMEAIRDAQVDCCNDSANNYGIVTLGCAIDDVVHFGDAGQQTITARIVQCVLYALGEATYARSPKVSQALRSGPTTVDVVITHSGGTDISPSTGITGFDVLDDGAPVTISSAVRLNATTVRLTLASAPTGTVTVRYGYGKNSALATAVSGVLRDNTALALFLETTDADLTAAGRRIVLDCIQRVGGAAAASVTGLRWAFFDQPLPNNFTAPSVKGTAESTDASGVLDIDVIGTTLNVGDVGFLVVSDTDGTLADSRGFAGPVQVSS